MSDTANQDKQIPATIPQYPTIQEGYQAALKVVDDVVLKNYISCLNKMEILPIKQDVLDRNIKDNVRFFKITEMVYEKEEFASYKFASVFNALSITDSSVFIIINSDGKKTDFYMGVRAQDPERTISSLRDTVENSMKGQFPGIKTVDCEIEEMQTIIDGMKADSISTVSCVAKNRAEEGVTNQNFVQGLEKLVLSMQGEKYTGIIIANCATQAQLKALRRGYESVYTQLSAYATTQLNYSSNSSTSFSVAKSEGTSQSESDSHTTNESLTDNDTKTDSESKENAASKTIKGVASAAAMVGAALAPVTGGISLAVGGVVSGGLGMLGSAMTTNVSKSVSKGQSFTQGTSDTHGTTETINYSISETKGYTKGTNEGMTLTLHDKSIEDMLERIDKQLERIDEFESLGMYECAAYFLSDSQYSAEMAASTYKALMRGENSGVEIAAVNSWKTKEKTEILKQYVTNFIHPVFLYDGPAGRIEVTPCSLVSGNELAIHMGLPRKSVCGLPVIEHADFGKEVVNYDGSHTYFGIKLGQVFNMGNVCPNLVYLDFNSLSMHTFVTGSTGSGKSNTIYELIRQCDNRGISFMVIEPAKGEYKHVFGNKPNVKVYGTNPDYTELLRINPFRFPKGIHVLEHVDRLVEIFNVCWPMYAAMPAVLKEALLSAYEVCGWDFATSKNAYDQSLYPTFMDLQSELVNVITNSAYSEEVKSNYMGSLVTRVKSLTNGLNGQIFSAKEIDNNVLFDKNVIIDLSRVGSVETKSMIMGILVMRLSEHRMSNAVKMNAPFNHVTVLEEAHNILRKNGSNQGTEGAGVASKAVEMISNAIAEMRTYGEGFVIVDQSPNSVDISAIRNTNTKIIMRLPDEMDRRLAGKAAGLKDDQLDEIAKLPKGVAVVYQNDWVDPILCKIQKFKGEENPYQYVPIKRLGGSTALLRRLILELLLKNRVNDSVDFSTDRLRQLLETAEISSINKLTVLKILNEYEMQKDLALWKESKFPVLSKIVSELLDGGIWVKSMVNTANEFENLTDEMIRKVQHMTGGISGEFALAAVQCLLKKEADMSDTYQEIYAGWVTELRNKGVF